VQARGFGVGANLPILLAESKATISAALSALFVFVSHSLGLTAQARILSALRAFPMIPYSQYSVTPIWYYSTRLGRWDRFPARIVDKYQ
jgi:hypothetical protein